MKVVFLSNKLTPHQVPFSNEMYRRLGDDFKFIETMHTDASLPIGWRTDGAHFPYVYTTDFFNKNQSICQKAIDEADALITGSAPEHLLKYRKSNRRLIFRYSERPLKTGAEPLKFVPRLIKWHHNNPPKAPIYILCASAYTASDYEKFGLFKNKCFRWGYFPEAKKYNSIEFLLSQKKPQSLLWAGRFIDWKHPEVPIEIAKRLKKEGYAFTLNMIGAGEMEDALKQEIQKEPLSDCVHLLGSMPPEKVREHMERSEIFLFTSDRNEGWGAVLNEAMNSACAVVASHAIGSVPFLIEDTLNGYIYKDGNIEDLYQKTKHLLNHQKKREQMATNAYVTIINEWNAENAVTKLLLLIESLLSNASETPLFREGICAPATHFPNSWYKKGEL